MRRLYAKIGPRSTQPIRQFLASSPPGASGGEDRRPMAWPAVIVLYDFDDGPMLFRYAIDGIFAGDTWHQTLLDAIANAEFEYGDALGRWEEIPEEVSRDEEVGFVLGVAG